MNMLRTAAAWLDKKRNDFLSEPIEFIHFEDGNQQKYELIATRGRTIFKVEIDYSIATRIHSTDFLVSSSLLPIMPQKGDEIISQGVRFEILAPNDEPVWRWSGTDNQTIRIHTKKIGEVNDAN